MHRRASTQDISWFLDLGKDQLDLDPPYQRRSVWTPKDRRFFLDTIFRGYPCPAVFLHKIPPVDGGQSKYAVVDGKQRLQTILMFANNEIAIASDFGDDRLNGKKWGQLTGEAERNLFWNYILPVEFLTFAEDDTHSVNTAFERMNRNSRKLEAQELRHARWEGWFMKLIEAECDEPSVQLWRRLGIATSSRAKRMREAQFISELLLVVIEKKQHGFSQEALDDAYARYDDVGEEETDENVDEEALSQEVDRLKNLLIGIENLNGTIRRMGGTLQSFYTLWVALTLNPEEFADAPRIAEKLALLLEVLEEIRSAANRPELVNGTPARYALPYEFFEGLRGASTDLAARDKRFTALSAFLRQP